MKFVIKLLLKAGVTLGVLFIAYRFLLPGMGGFDLSGFTDKAPKGLNNIGEPVVKEDVTVYQWTDAQGVTHYGGTPPTGQASYETREIRTNTNVMQRLKVQEEEEKTSDSAKVARVGSPYDPENVKNIIDDAKNIQKEMEERKAATDELLNNL